MFLRGVEVVGNSELRRSEGVSQAAVDNPTGRQPQAGYPRACGKAVGIALGLVHQLFHQAPADAATSTVCGRRVAIF